MTASQLVAEVGDSAALADILGFVEVSKGPWPTGVIAQRTRLEAVAGYDGLLAAGEIESLFRKAIQLMQA